MAERKPRQGGLGGLGRERIRQNLGRGSSESVAGHPLFSNAPEPQQVPTTTAWQFPDSTRIKAYQYDYATRQLRVRFNKYNTPWVYNDVPVTVFQSFDASDSKGRYVNSTLNYMDYREATPQEEASYFSEV